MTNRARTLIAIAAFAVVAAACGDDDDTTANADAAAATTTTESAAATTATTTGGGAGDTTEAGSDAAAVEVSDSSLGQILTSDGNTLYLYMPDNGGPSTCYDQCAQNWPPLTVDGDATGGDGVTADVATSARTDGAEQVTVDGWPMYFFAGDSAAGDVNGQGVGGVWFAVGPDGQPVQGTAADGLRGY